MLKLLQVSKQRLLTNIYKISTNKIQIQLPVIDVKNSHLFYVKDNNSLLPYFCQIESQNGSKGVVMKLESNAISVVGFYQHMENNGKINITKISTYKNLINTFTSNFNTIYNYNLEQIDKIKDVQSKSSMKCQFEKQGKRSKIKTLSPILATCHDMFIGDFINFTGGLGSGRTSNALKILQCFTNSTITNPIGIYLNTNQNDYKQTCLKAASNYRTISFGRNINQIKSRQQNNVISSVGVYMLAVKVIMLANKLKYMGNNVMLIVDNIHQILANQWTVLQNLNFPISAFSILNQLYSSCSERVLQNHPPNNKSEGSLTTIAISNPQKQDIIQQYSTLGNNSKHLQTLVPPIQFPLQLAVNTNKTNSNIVSGLREYINCFIREKKDKDILAKLKLIKQQPWQHYFILDGQWWSIALRKYIPNSIGDLTLFLWFILINIQEDYIAHWRVDCIDAYHRYIEFLAKPEDPSTIGMEMNQIQSFIQICKNQKIFDVFKKDYLS